MSTDLVIPSPPAPPGQLRILLDWLITGQVIDANPAAAVRAAKHVVKKGKTPVLKADEACELLDSIPLKLGPEPKEGEEHNRQPSLIGLRDRARIAVMVFSFDRIGAALDMKVEDYYTEGRRAWFLLHEKGGKRHEVPAHHNAGDYLDAYIAAAGIAAEKKTPLFRSIDRYRRLTSCPMHRIDAWRMIKRRAKAIGLPEEICNHTFGATGITAYLEKKRGAPSSTPSRSPTTNRPRRPKLYDRSSDQIDLDEIERIRIWGVARIPVGSAVSLSTRTECRCDCCVVCIKGRDSDRTQAGTSSISGYLVLGRSQGKVGVERSAEQIAFWEGAGEFYRWPRSSWCTGSTTNPSRPISSRTTGSRRWRGECGWRAGGTSLTGSGPRAPGPTRSSAGRRIMGGCSAHATGKGSGRTPATGRRSKPPRPEALALEWLEHVAEGAPAGSADAEQARLALDIARDPARAGAMGVGNVLRQILKTLARVSWLANMGMPVAELFYTSLAQVTRYLTDDETRAQAREAVLGFVTNDTRAIIGHSLGSVVAYECAHRLDRPLLRLVTLGSPLGLRTLVADRLDPPPSFPPRVAAWLNVANREDVVAAEPDLRPRFARDVPAAARFESVWFAEPGKDPHRATTYLGRMAVGRAVIQALA